MMNLLHSLYQGKIIPWERRNPSSEKQLEILRKIESEEQYFTQKMSQEDCERYQALSCLQMDLSSEAEASIFSYGFALGLHLMMDIAEETNRIAQA